MKRIVAALLISWLSGCSKTSQIYVAPGEHLYVGDPGKNVYVTLVDSSDILSGAVVKNGKEELLFVVRKDRVSTSRFVTDKDGIEWEIMDLDGNGIPYSKTSLNSKATTILKYYGGEFRSANNGITNGEKEQVHIKR